MEDLMQQGGKGLGSLVKTSPAERMVLVVDQFDHSAQIFRRVNE